MCIKVLLLLKCLLVSCLFQPIMLEGKAPEHYVWLNFSSTVFSRFTEDCLKYPKAGFASYFQSQSHLIKSQQPVLKKYFNLYQTSSQLVRTNTIVCEQIDHQPTFCENISDSYLYSNDLIPKKSSIGDLVDSNPLQKSLHFIDGSELKFYQRNQNNEIIQYVFVVLICFFILIFQISLKQKIIIDSLFFIQLFIVLSTYLCYCSDYVKEAIQDWNDKKHQFWFFIPLALISYKLIESVAERSLSKPIPIAKWLMVSIVNFCLIYLVEQQLFFDLLSYFLLLRCKVQEQDLSQQHTLAQKFTKSAQRKVSLLYLIVNLALVFKKLWLYCISVIPYYFVLRVSLICFFYCFLLYRNKASQKQQQMMLNQYKVKVILTRKELNLQHPSRDISSDIDQQCPICYERIVSKWAKTPCGHIFHDQCLYKWLQKSQTCPIDRKKVINDKIPPQDRIILASASDL